VIFNLTILTIFGALWAITSPLRLLSNATLPAGFQSALDSLGAYISPLNEIFPVLTLFSVFGIIITIELSIQTYKLIMWTLKRLPTQS